MGFFFGGGGGGQNADRFGGIWQLRCTGHC